MGPAVPSLDPSTTPDPKFMSRRESSQSSVKEYGCMLAGLLQFRLELSNEPAVLSATEPKFNPNQIFAIDNQL
jgi:hypothetical protein